MPAEPRPASPKGRTALVALLFAVAVISYVDRGSLSIAAPILKRDLGLSPLMMGTLLSSFFWSYAVLQVVAGWLVDRFSVGMVLACGVAIWSLATLGSGLAVGMGSLILLRLALGAGEAVLFPVFSKAIAAAFPADSRGLPNAIIDAGTKIGPALGVLIGGLIVARHGWRVLFLVLGAASILWLIPWLVWTARHRLAPPTIEAVTPDSPAAVPTLLDILRTRDAWGVFIGSGCYTYAYFFLLTWLPTYLVQERHMSMSRMAVLGSLPYLASAVAALVTGFASDALIRRGASATAVRKPIVAVGLLLSTLALPSAFVADEGLSIGLLSLAYVAFGVFASNLWAISQTLAGRAAAGQWAGLQNSIGAATGIAAPLITGLIVQRTGSFQLAFGLTAVLAVVGAASYLFVVGPIGEIDWAARIGPSAAEGI
jgi:ACS family D-galactonate transporter-like MFS transporter